MSALPAKTMEILTGNRDEWKENLICNDKGNPKPLLANCTTALRNSPEWRDVLGFNDFSLSVAAICETPWGRTGTWTDNDDRLAAEWLQNNGLHVPVEIAGQAVQTVANERRFHPVREHLRHLKWDGKHRAETWLRDYLGVEDSNYSRAVAGRFLLASVARIFQPGAKVDTCLILEGAQGIQKSTALRVIAEPWFSDEIADLGTKDASLQCAGVWLIELSELDSMSKSDIAKIKAFMSRNTDRFRPPYGRRIIESPRQCVFAGSVNHSTYLRDETGGRRFWPVQCGKIDIPRLKDERDRLWAEAVALFDAGKPWWLDSEELVQAASIEQEARYDGDPWDELIAKWTVMRQDISVSEVLSECLDKPKGQWTQADKNRVARSLRATGWERYNARTEAGREWRYRHA
ncbi:MAG: VapE domain-containing protein [Bryobacteraceae bacterium]